MLLAIRTAPVAVRALIASVAILGFEERAAAQEPRQLASQLRETLSGLNTIEATFTEAVSGQLRPPGSGPAVPLSYEWISSGERQRLLIRSGELLLGWWSFDGEHGYSVGFNENDPRSIRDIRKAAAAPQVFTGRYTPAFWLGRQLPHVAEPLDDLLRGPQARVLGEQSLDGLEVIAVDLGTHDTPHTGRWRCSTLLCPGRDGLPIEIRIAPAADNPDFDAYSSTYGEYVFAVREFKRIDDEKLRRERWMPWRMAMTTTIAEVSTHITQLRLNHPVAQSAFRPPPPQPGTVLIDETAHPSKRRTIHAPRLALKRKAEEAAAELKEQASGRQRNVASRPDAYRWTRWAAWCGSILLLSAAVLYLARARREA